MIQQLLCLDDTWEMRDTGAWDFPLLSLMAVFILKGALRENTKHQEQVPPRLATAGGTTSETCQGGILTAGSRRAPVYIRWLGRCGFFFPRSLSNGCCSLQLSKQSFQGPSSWMGGQWLNGSVGGWVGLELRKSYTQGYETPNWISSKIRIEIMFWFRMLEGLFNK